MEFPVFEVPREVSVACNALSTKFIPIASCKEYFIKIIFTKDTSNLWIFFIKNSGSKGKMHPEIEIPQVQLALTLKTRAYTNSTA